MEMSELLHPASFYLVISNNSALTSSALPSIIFKCLRLRINTQMEGFPRF
jgi:hypothetical protein